MIWTWSVSQKEDILLKVSQLFITYVHSMCINGRWNSFAKYAYLVHVHQVGGGTILVNRCHYMLYTPQLRHSKIWIILTLLSYFVFQQEASVCQQFQCLKMCYQCSRMYWIYHWIGRMPFNLRLTMEWIPGCDFIDGPRQSVPSLIQFTMNIWYYNLNRHKISQERLQHLLHTVTKPYYWF